MDRTTRDNNNERTCITHRERARSNKKHKSWDSQRIFTTHGH